MKSRITKSGGVTRYPTGGAIVHESEDHLDEVLVTQWAASCLHLLVSIFGKESDHYRIFKDLAPVLTDYSNGTRNVKKVVAIMMAAKEDVEQGYLADSRSLIQAEIFDDLLEQASHFWIRDITLQPHLLPVLSWKKLYEDFVFKITSHFAREP